MEVYWRMVGRSHSANVNPIKHIPNYQNLWKRVLSSDACWHSACMHCVLCMRCTPVTRRHLLNLHLQTQIYRRRPFAHSLFIYICLHSILTYYLRTYEHNLFSFSYHASSFFLFYPSASPNPSLRLPFSASLMEVK